jgi:hypothetical protein
VAENHAPAGSATFAIPPGETDPGGFVGETLFA